MGGGINANLILQCLLALIVGLQRFYPVTGVIIVQHQVDEYRLPPGVQAEDLLAQVDRAAKIALLGIDFSQLGEHNQVTFLQAFPFSDGPFLIGIFCQKLPPIELARQLKSLHRVRQLLLFKKMAALVSRSLKNGHIDPNGVINALLCTWL